MTDITMWGSRGTASLILQGLQSGLKGGLRVRAVIDDLDHGALHPRLNVPMISADERKAAYSDLPVLLAMGSPELRAKIFHRLTHENAQIFTHAPTGPRVEPDIITGAGTILVPETRVGPNVKLGQGIQGLARLISHDIEIDDFTTLGYRSAILGHVKIGARVSIGPGAIIGNGTLKKPLTIGDDAIIAPGAVVLSPVRARARMVGNPAIRIQDWAILRRLARKSP